MCPVVDEFTTAIHLYINGGALKPRDLFNFTYIHINLGTNFMGYPRSNSYGWGINLSNQKFVLMTLDFQVGSFLCENPFLIILLV